MAEAFIEKTEYNQYLSAPDYIDQFYGDKEGISTTKLLSSPILLSTSDYLFSDFTGLEYVYFPNLSFISHKAFAGCVNLKEVNFQNVSYVESYAFKDCTSLKYLDLPKCTSMRANAFEGCNSLEELSLPKWSMFTSSYGVGNEYSNYYALFENLPNLSLLNIADRSKPVRLINLPKLETLIASNLISLGTMSSLDYSHQNQLSAGYFENLPLLSSLVFDNLSILYSRAFVSVPSLDTLILPECVQIYSNVFTGEMPDNIMTVLPKVKSMNFTGNHPFKSLIFPAPSNGSDLGYFYGTADNAPEYIEFTNISTIENTTALFGIFMSYGYRSIINHDTFLSFPNLEYIISNTYRWDTSANYSNTHVIINMPKLKELCSSAFYNLRILKEINLAYVSVLNNDVFMDTACFKSEHSTNGLLLSNTYNIKEVKAGAFYGTKLRDNILYLPNCEKFDFRQYGSSGYYRYSLAIYNEDASTTWFSQRIDNIHLPKLSEIVIDANLHYDRYSSFTYIDLMFPQKEMRFEECKRIQYLDGSSRFFYNRQSLYEMESFETLYIPECSIMEYIHNDSMPYTNGISLYYPVHKLYAPKLTNINYIRFLNTYDLTVPFSSLSSICLEYWLGFISNLSISESFNGLIDIRYYNVRSSRQGSFYLSNISLPNYTGDFYLRPSSNQYSSIYSIVNIYLGNDIKYISMSLLYQTSGYKNKTNVTILKNILNNNVRIQDSSYWGMDYSYRDISYNYPNCSLINYSFSYSTTIFFYSWGVTGMGTYYMQYDEFDEYCKIWENYGTLSLPNCEKMHIDIVGYNSISVVSNSYIKYSNITIGFTASEIYAPNFSKITISIPDGLRSYFNSDITCTMQFFRVKSLTLGISDIHEIGGWDYTSNGSSYLDSLGLGNVEYLSLSNLKGICSMSHRVQIYTLSLEKCTSLYIPNIEYISDYGINVSKLTVLNLPKVSYLGNYAISGSLLKTISIPKVEHIENNVFYGCSNLKVLTLPSTCSMIGSNAWPGSLEILRLEYNGVVNMTSEYYWQNWHAMTIQVPMSKVQSYRDDSKWGQALSQYSSYGVNIVGY